MSSTTRESHPPGLEEWYDTLEAWGLALTRSILPVWPWVALAAPQASARVAETHPPFPTYPPGKTIDEISVGDNASLSKRVSQDDIDGFARVSGDDNPAHVDEEWAAASFLGGRVAHGVLTAGLISAVLGTQLPGPGSIYMSQTLKWVAPVRPGDVVTATVTVKEIWSEKSRLLLDTVVTKDGEPVLTGEALVMAPRTDSKRGPKAGVPAQPDVEVSLEASAPSDDANDGKDA